MTIGAMLGLGLLLVMASLYRQRWLDLDSEHARILNAIHRNIPSSPISAPYPEYDEAAFWLYPDWDAAGDQAVWMVPQKKPANALNEYERGLNAGRLLWDNIEALAVDNATKSKMRYELALQLAQRNEPMPQVVGERDALSRPRHDYLAHIGLGQRSHTRH